MKKLSILSAFLLLSLAASGCTAKDATPAAPDAPKAAEKAPTDAGATAIYDVKCGCSIADIGHCGNYILIDGKYVPLVHPSLGAMQFCSKKAAGAKIEAVGAMKDGKFVAESWKPVQ